MRALLAICSLILLCLARASINLEVGRLIQFDHAGKEFGSRRVNLNLLASAPADELTDEQRDADVFSLPSDALAAAPTPGAPAPVDDDDDEVPPPAAPPAAAAKSSVLSGRRVMLVRFADLTSARLTELAASAAGLVLLLPADLTSVSEKELARWRRLEQFLLSHKFDIPIYFAFEGQELTDVYSSLVQSARGRETTSDRVQVNVNAGEASAISPLPTYNLQGMLHGTPMGRDGSDADGLPMIALVANYDSFGAAAKFAFGVDQNGSGVIALLEVARMFNRLYSEYRTQGRFNLLFLLTGGGRQNFAGTRNWLKNVDARVLESLELVVCLDSLAAGDKLYLHVSKQPKLESVRSIYDTFTGTAQALGIDFELVHRRINVSAPYLTWHHDQFAKKRRALVAATLSARPGPAPLHSGSSILDTRALADQDALVRNIRFVAEVLARRIYGPPAGDKADARIIAGSADVNEPFVSAWLDYLGATPRVSAYLAKDEVVGELEKALSQAHIEVKKISFNLESGYKFYKEASDPKMIIYRVKPITFNLLILAGILAYLAAFYAFIKGPSVVTDVQRLFKR